MSILHESIVLNIRVTQRTYPREFIVLTLPAIHDDVLRTSGDIIMNQPSNQ
ncbi:hypothetical protein ACFL6A_00765 [bacterium]